jgi:hypothetical protein
MRLETGEKDGGYSGQRAEACLACGGVVVDAVRFLRRSRRGPVSEALAYSRCHGDRGRNLVRRIVLEPRRARYPVLELGESLRRQFESRLAPRR